VKVKLVKLGVVSDGVTASEPRAIVPKADS
jgi:hypothetical protein